MELADRRKTVAWALLLLGLPAAAGPAQSAAPVADAALVCREQTTRIERLERLPRQILSAIALAEAGRWDARRGETIAWPWTVYAERQGRFLASKAAAVAEVRSLLARGVRNIDVGCMQINLRHHPHTFADLDEAFDPAANVAYAGRFIKRLHRDARSWGRATALYHSRTRALGLPYRHKVQGLWREERREERFAALEERRLERRAQTEKRRAAAHLAALRPRSP